VKQARKGMDAVLMILFVSMLSVSTNILAANLTHPVHKVVFQVDSADPAVQNLVLNNAVNVQKHYGMDNVTIEVVAYGPGLSLLTKHNKQAQRVESLAMQDIRFSACNNTIQAITRKTGKKPELDPGVKVVPGGVVRIMELEEHGYSYVRP
jgi:intracellular sulfur oxidation DsrE/DsrF family protein